MHVTKLTRGSLVVQTLGVMVAALALTVAVGCDDNGDGGDDGNSADGGGGGSDGGGGGSDSGGGGGGGDPVSGFWIYTETAVLQDTCNASQTPSNGGGGFQIINNGDGTLIIDPDDGSDPFSCTLEASGAFTCLERLDRNEPVGAGFDATFEIRVSAQGVFTSNTEGNGEQHGTVTCAGADCAAAEVFLGTSFPCQVDVSFDIESAI